MIKYILFNVFCFTSALAFSQVRIGEIDTTTSVYGDLPVKKFYTGGSRVLTEKGYITYEVGGRKVSKRFYNYYSGFWNNMVTCKPCVLVSYDINERLVYKAIQYTDCRIGYAIEYYPNGQVKMIGHYRENSSNDWNNAWTNGYCSNKDGKFIYFDESGKHLYSEYWESGRLIKKE